jgi:hypothetical protein
MAAAPPPSLPNTWEPVIGRIGSSGRIMGKGENASYAPTVRISLRSVPRLVLATSGTAIDERPGS